MLYDGLGILQAQRAKVSAGIQYTIFCSQMIQMQKLRHRQSA